MTTEELLKLVEEKKRKLRIELEEMEKKDKWYPLYRICHYITLYGSFLLVFLLVLLIMKDGSIH